MGRRVRDRLVDLGEHQRKLFLGAMALWKTGSAWDPWQMGMGGRRELDADRAKTRTRYIAWCRRNTRSPRGPSV